MACENDKCEKYGMHHDYKRGIETRKCHFCEKDNQPERLNPEDAKYCKSLPDSLNWCDATSVCDSLTSTNK